MTELHEIKAPEGFIEITSGSDGYLLKVPGNTIQGILERHREYRDRNGDERSEFQVKITAGETMCAVRDADGQDWIEDVLKSGSTVGIDCTANLQALIPYATGEYELFLGVKGKTPLPGGKSAWQFTRAVRKLESAPIDADKPPF